MQYSEYELLLDFRIKKLILKFAQKVSSIDHAVLKSKYEDFVNNSNKTKIQIRNDYRDQQTAQLHFIKTNSEIKQRENEYLTFHQQIELLGKRFS